MGGLCRVLGGEGDGGGRRRADAVPSVGIWPEMCIYWLLGEEVFRPLMRSNRARFAVPRLRLRRWVLGLGVSCRDD